MVSVATTKAKRSLSNNPVRSVEAPPTRQTIPNTPDAGKSIHLPEPSRIENANHNQAKPGDRKMNAVAVPSQRFAAQRFITLIETLRAARRSNGGSEGRMYPGSLDLEIEKKSKQKTDQLVSSKASALI